MRFFTPELIALGCTQDDEQLNEQERLWDEAGERYVAYLGTIRPSLPPGVSRLLNDYYLHDSIIQGMGQQGHVFVIVLRLDTPPRSLLTLEYDLVDEPAINRDVLPVELRTQGGDVDWQYDEIEMVPGSPPTWRQSILLNNGWEVRLHFRDVRIQEVQPLIPVTTSPAPASAVNGSLS